ncbi:hypothetical protein NC651_005696 [Populus alba x Populus x berolinensis]|nr:hypothetical protein NC651_005696 [Populus alba x Populus x berolinensis]
MHGTGNTERQKLLKDGVEEKFLKFLSHLQVLHRRRQIRTLLIWTRYASSFYVYSSDFPRDQPAWISLTCAVSSR